MKQDCEFIGKVALVTGAARGIGLSIARRLAEEGARVFIADINFEKGMKVAQSLSEEGLCVDFLPCDLAVLGGADSMVTEVFRLVGRLDILVNNARAGRHLSLFEETEESWDLALGVGLKAVFFAAQGTIRRMSGRGGCCIVNIGSVAAVQATQESPAYHAAKSGLLNLTKYLAVEGGAHRARVNCVLPGLIVQQEHRPRFDSESNKAYRAAAVRYQPLDVVGTEDDVAEAVLYLCSERARYVSGISLTLDGGATAQEPFGLLIRELVADK